MCPTCPSVSLVLTNWGSGVSNIPRPPQGYRDLIGPDWIQDCGSFLCSFQDGAWLTGMTFWTNLLMTFLINLNIHDKLKLGPLKIQLQTLFGTPGLSLDNCVSQFWSISKIIGVCLTRTGNNQENWNTTGSDTSECHSISHCRSQEGSVGVKRWKVSNQKSDLNLNFRTENITKTRSATFWSVLINQKYDDQFCIH